MKYKGLLLLCANLILVATAPVQDAEIQDALLQRALDDAAIKRHAVAAARDSQSTDESGQSGEDFVLNVLEKFLDFAKRKYGKGTPSSLSTKFDSSSAAVESSTGEDVALELLEKVFDFAKRKYNQSRSSNPSTLQRVFNIDTNEGSISDDNGQDGLQSDHSSLVETPDAGLPRALPYIPFLRPPTTEDPFPNPVVGQRFLPKVVPNTYRPVDPYVSQGTADDTEEAKLQAIAALLGTAFKALKGLSILKNLIPKSGSRSGSNSETNIVDRGRGTSPSGYGNLARRFLGFPGENEYSGFNGPSNSLQGGNTNIEADEEKADEQVTNEAEIEKFKWLKSIVGKTLKVLNHKLKPRSRSPEEDREAVNRPTRWKDLGRNLLGTIGDRLDPTGEELQAEIELLTRQIEDGGSENSAAEIEGLRSFLSKALERLDSKLKPSSRLPEEDDEAVADPRKWTDLGRNFIRVLRDKLDKQKTGPEEEVETEVEDMLPDQDFQGEIEETAQIEKFWKKVIPTLIKGYELYRKFKKG